MRHPVLRILVISLLLRKMVVIHNCGVQLIVNWYLACQYTFSNVKSQEYIEVWLEKYLSFLVIVVNNRYLPKCKFELESSAQLFFEKIQAFLDLRGFDFCNF